MEDKRFYVYEFIRLDTGDPFYIGKGCGNRVNDTHRGRSEWFKNTLKKHGAVSRIIVNNLTEKEAYEAEVWFIYEYKHILNYKLVNLDDGGRGANSGKDNPMYGKRGKLSPNYGRRPSLEQRLHTSQGLKGKPKTEDHKRKLSLVKMGKYAGKNNPNYGNGEKISGGKNPASIKIKVTDKLGIITIFETKEETAEYFKISPYLLNKLMGKVICVDKDFNREKDKYRLLEGYKFEEMLNEGVTTMAKASTL